MAKWQPIIIIADTRIDCLCGAMAIFVFLEEDSNPDPNERDMRYAAMCQACYVKEQERGKEEKSNN